MVFIVLCFQTMESSGLTFYFQWDEGRYFRFRLFLNFRGSDFQELKMVWYLYQSIAGFLPLSSVWMILGLGTESGIEMDGRLFQELVFFTFQSLHCEGFQESWQIIPDNRFRVIVIWLATVLTFHFLFLKLISHFVCLVGLLFLGFCFYSFSPWFHLKLRLGQNAKAQQSKVFWTFDWRNDRIL